MKTSLKSINRNLALLRSERRTYRNLQKHLNKQAVGYPATLTGVELRFLKGIFTTEEAKLALFMSDQSEPFEHIFQRVKESGYTEADLQSLLGKMEKKGGIFVRDFNTTPTFALHPFVVGMFEMQLSKLNPEIYLNLRSYLLQGFGMEYLTAEIPQVRTIPVQKSLTPELRVSTYDEIREIVDRNASRISIADCICKKGKDLIGTPCKVTDRREVCMFFRNYNDTYVRNGWARAVSKEEAMEILDQNEKDGLILMPSNSQWPQFVCSCCSCCCGIMELISFVPRAVDHTASNFHASLNASACKGCGKCKSRCHVDAIKFEDKSEKPKVIAIDGRKCIGCGLCVTACKTGAFSLVKNDIEFIPPKNYDALHDFLMEHKKKPVVKAARMLKTMLGMKKNYKLKHGTVGNSDHVG
jgi:Na+-translocating ferredoxin:NAD+ oxidoreductase subunit B